MEPVSRHKRLEWLSRLMDNSIRLPGGYRIGWDGVIGLVPGVGDLVGFGVSSYIVMEAYKLGISKATLLKMLTNIGIEVVIGAIPIVGDLFDLAFKSNNRNMRLLDKHLQYPVKVKKESQLQLALIVIVAAVILVTTLWVSIRLITMIFQWMF